MKKIGALVLGVLVGGCALANVANEPAPNIYVLTAPAVASGEGAAMDVQVLVEVPTAPAAIDTNRIVYQPTPNEIQYYADARWSDRAPQMVQTLFAETLENTHRLQAVSRQRVGLRSDYALQSELRTFAAHPAESGSAPVVEIRFNVKVLREADDQIVASKMFVAQETAESGSIRAVVDAFDRALGAVLADAAPWTVAKMGGSPVVPQ